MMIFKRSLLAALVPLGLTTGLSAPAWAQNPSTGDTELAVETLPAAEGAAGPHAAPNLNAYPADYFDLYVPRTALDMVQRIPGFRISRGNSGQRGLGQGGANILINGERLTGKTDPFDELDQIIATRVVEIRIREGATLSIPGLSGQVADIIVERSESLQGTWEWNPSFREALEPNLLNGEVNLSGEADILGGMTYALQLRDYAFRSGARATEVLRDTSGRIFETRAEDIQNNGDRPGIALNLGWVPGAGHKVNLNTEYSLFNFNRAARAVRIPFTERGDDRLTFAARSEDEWRLEIDGDYELPVGPGRLKITGVLDREHSPTSSSFLLIDPVTGFDGESRFLQVGEELELIGRAEYSWSGTPGRDWQIAGEMAYNELDIEQEFLSRNPGDVLAGSDPTGFVVSEDRSEVTLTHNRPLNARWDLQTSVGLEYSKLMQSRTGTDSIEPRTFYRPKGFVSATYKVDDSLRLRVRAEREVGQLNFFDFVSSVDLEDNLGREGNPDLVPSQSWLGSLNAEKDFGQGNTVQVELYGAAISDTVDRIPIGVDGDGVGNIGTAYRYGVDLTSTIKGERWNLPGTELNVTVELRGSTVDDPVLGFARRLNGDKSVYYDIGYRHDIPGTDWAYGGFLERFISARQYRLFSINRNGVDRPFLGAFVEHKDLAGMTLRVSLMNLLEQNEFFERDLFTARRDTGVLQQTERIDFDYGPFVRLTLSGAF